MRTDARGTGTAVILAIMAMSVALFSPRDAALASTPSSPAPAVARSATTATSGATATLRRHLKVKQTFPAANATLVGSPDAIRLWMTERVELPASKITVTNARGKALAMNKPSRDGEALAAKFAAPLPPGRYVVAWRVMSKDGHLVKGTFAFRIAPSGT